MCVMSPTVNVITLKAKTKNMDLHRIRSLVINIAVHKNLTVKMHKDCARIQLFFRTR